MKIVSFSEWERIEQALMEAEIPYKVSFDSHTVGDGKVVHDRIIEIEIFKIQTMHMENSK